MSVKRIMEKVKKTVQGIEKAKARQPKKPEPKKINCFDIDDNVVDSPLALTNLNVKIPAKGYLTNVAETTALKYPVAMVIYEDSMLIIGHHGKIFDHLDFH
ncbi:MULTISPECIES: hypothetical protein [unclassified Candidatus Tisiphia]|uniref:hypothetical protein n=1 Tax=unclassified Candidatus Tisiphia TaxID=2996318 RepID=UPI003CCB0260